MLAGCTACLLAAVSGLPPAQAQSQAGTPAAAPAATTAAPRSGAAAPPKAAAVRPAATRPEWSELTPSQQRALAPLAGTWATISVAQKRKWVTLSQNYSALPPAEQSKLHARMTDWVALSPQQRSQARLNFAEVRQLTPDDRQAKWQQYQALSEAEKRKLAAQAGVRAPGAAVALKPVPRQKLASVPANRKHLREPRVAAVPEHFDGSTLLPMDPAAGNDGQAP